MSDPSRGYQDPAQKKAAEHATAQAIANITGSPATQLRTSLAGFARNITAIQTARVRETNPPPPPQFDITESKFEAQPLTLGLDSAGATSPQPFGGGGTDGNRQFKVILGVDGSGNNQVGVYFYSEILIDGSPGNTMDVQKTLTSITPTPSDSGWFALSSLPAVIFLYCDINDPSDWATLGPITASGTNPTIAIRVGSADLPAGGMFEMTYDAGPPVTGVPLKTRLILGIVRAGAVMGSPPLLVEWSYPQLIIVSGPANNYDSGASNSLVITSAWPGAV